jgi:hypothetical protein
VLTNLLRRLSRSLLRLQSPNFAQNHQIYRRVKRHHPWVLS